MKKEAYKSLLKNDRNSNDDLSDESTEKEVDELGRINMTGQKNRYEDDDPYINCDFVLCSSAEVVHVRRAGYCLDCDAHAGTYPITLEAIIYLMYNKD